jgi:four helix bundle protein
MGKHNYRELRVWKEAMELCKSVYTVVAEFPEEEKYGLSSQIRRCAISIPSNIAEGAGRATNKMFSHFLSIAYGSTCELSTQLELARDFQMMEQEEYPALDEKIVSIQKMIYILSENLKINS